jgi:hypothetical protein
VSRFLPNSKYWLRQAKYFDKVTTGVTSCSTQFIKNVIVSAHFSGHHQTCAPEPMKETIQIIYNP